MEAHHLANWLGDVADGNPTRRIFFTEPNLSFEVESVDPTKISLKLYFAAEALPPGVSTGDEEFYELFRVSPAEVRAAANELCQNLQPFPVRAGARQWAPPCRDR
jgi:hypothetical protein